VRKSAESTPSPPAKKGAMKDPVADEWEQRLTAIQPASTWGSYGKERKACKTLAQRTRNLVPETPLESESEIIEAAIAEYQRLKAQNRSDYWRNAAYAPSQVLQRWPSIWESVARRFDAVQEEMPF
jgi:hypothetical protein